LVDAELDAATASLEKLETRAKKLAPPTKATLRNMSRVGRLLKADPE